MRRRRWLVLSALISVLVACSSPTPKPEASTATPVPAATIDLSLISEGGGEPRSAGYWLVWNGCAEGNQSEVAAANGGREAGWIIMDDLLLDPGILVGTDAVESCEQGVVLLARQDPAGDLQGDDVAYRLASAVLAAQLNLAAGAEYCPKVGELVQSAQVVLISVEFDGTGMYLRPGADSEQVALAEGLAEQLERYNAGMLCR